MAGHYTYATSLRVVGQLLQQRNLDLFELNYFDHECFLRCGGPIPPYLDLLQFSHSLEELNALDGQARANRGASFGLVNFQSLPEILRAVGHRIDEQEGQLLRICNADSPSLNDWVTIEYRTRDKKRHVEEFVVAALGDQAMRMYKHRLRSRAN